MINVPKRKVRLRAVYICNSWVFPALNDIYREMRKKTKHVKNSLGLSSFLLTVKSEVISKSLNNTTKRIGRIKVKIINRSWCLSVRLVLIKIDADVRAISKTITVLEKNFASLVLFFVCFMIIIIPIKRNIIDKRSDVSIPRKSSLSILIVFMASLINA